MSGLSLPEGWYETTDLKVIEQSFGKNEYISATVYVNEAERRFEGVEVDFELPETIEERSYGTQIDRATSLVNFKWGETLNLSKPTEFISQDEFDALLDRFNPAAEI